MNTQQKKELLNWSKHNYPTQYQQKFTRINKLVDELEPNVKVAEGRKMIVELLIK